MTDKSMPNLSAFELRGTADIAKYAEALRDVSRAMANELDFTAAELQTTLSRVSGWSIPDKFAARLKARKVTRRLRRCRDLYIGAALEAVKFWAQYRAEYDPLIQPANKPQAQPWKWSA